MSQFTMNIIYAVCIALFGVIMIISPRTFLGRAKFDESAYKTEKLIKKGGIGIVVIGIALFIGVLIG